MKKLHCILLLRECTSGSTSLEGFRLGGAVNTLIAENSHQCGQAGAGPDLLGRQQATVCKLTKEQAMGKQWHGHTVGTGAF